MDRKEKPIEIVKIGQRLDAYHDGKVSPSRLAIIVVDDIIERGDLSKKAQRIWKSALKEDFRKVFNGSVFYCGPKGLFDATTTKQFWDWNCTEFIVGHILNDKETEKDPILFAKRPDGFGWYGINWNYSLDITGKIRKRNIKNWKICAEECNWTMKWNVKNGKYDYFDIVTGRRVPM